MSLPTLSVDIGFTGANTYTYLHLDDVARGLLGTGTLAPEEVWEDVSEYVQSVSTNRGSSRVESPLIRYEAGTATVVLRNTDRRFDPTNLDGPYVVADASQLTPMRVVRIRATWDGVVYDLFRGYADSWQVSYDGPNNSTCTLIATDAFKVFAGIDRSAVVAVGAGEDAGARIDRILDSLGWSATDRIVADGDTTLQATTLEGDGLTELQLTADTELGEFYIDGAGRAVFRNRHALMEDDRSNTPQAEFGDLDPELRYAEVELAYDDDQMANDVRITRVGGAEQTAEDTLLQDEYLVRTFERSDLLMQSDATAADYARFILHTSKDPELRFSSLTVNPLRDETNLFPQVLGREIGDRITIIRRPPGGGDPIERDVIIRGISHQSLSPGSWGPTVWTLQSASRLSFLTLDNASLGVLGSNALAF